MQPMMFDRVCSLPSKRFTSGLAIVALLVAMALPAHAAERQKPKAGTPAYLDTTRSFEERAADLVSRLTLEEKAALM